MSEIQTSRRAEKEEEEGGEEEEEEQEVGSRTEAVSFPLSPVSFGRATSLLDGKTLFQASYPSFVSISLCLTLRRRHPANVQAALFYNCHTIARLIDSADPTNVCLNNMSSTQLSHNISTGSSPAVHLVLKEHWISTETYLNLIREHAHGGDAAFATAVCNLLDSTLSGRLSPRWTQTMHRHIVAVCLEPIAHHAASRPSKLVASLTTFVDWGYCMSCGCPISRSLM